MNDWVEVGPKGVIGTFTILRFAFIDPETGAQKPVPYGYGFIKLDGADTLFQHYISVEDEQKIKVGARVEPVFAKIPRAASGTLSTLKSSIDVHKGVSDGCDKSIKAHIENAGGRVRRNQHRNR